MNMVFTPEHIFSQYRMYPVSSHVISQEKPPPINGDLLWFTLTAATPTLTRLLFPKFFDSEMGHAMSIIDCFDCPNLL